jgi:hypothetical protein
MADLALTLGHMQIAPGQIAIDMMAQDPLLDQRLGLLCQVEALFGGPIPELGKEHGLYP